MEEKKNRFFDFDVEEVSKPKPVDTPKANDAFSKVFGNEEEHEPKVEAKKVPTFQDVFKTEIKVEEPKEEIKTEGTTSIPKASNPVFKAQDVFKTEIKLEEKKVEKKQEEVINSSKFFNAEPKIEGPQVEIKEVEEPLYVEKIGDNPMVDYDRINREAEENKPEEEAIEEIPKEDPSQSNNTVNRRIRMNGSDLMKLRMTRR